MIGRPQAKPGAARAKVRDKRLTMPNLFIDLRDKVYKTRVWAPGKFILSDYDGGAWHRRRFYRCIENRR